MAKQGLGLVQTQTQKLSPLQIQTIKLIELPIQDLEQRVRRELEENPVLDDTPVENEDSKEISLDDIQQDDYIPDYKTKVSNWGKDARPDYVTFSVKESFFFNLREQLSFKNLSKQDSDIAYFIVGSLDEDGYLRRDLDSLMDDLAFRAGINCEREDVERMLKVVQSLDPPGVGARDLRECLLLQLKAANQTPQVRLATDILTKDFDAFASKHYNKIMQSRGISEDDMKAVLKVILRLNPAPGGSVADSYADVTEQIVPDFVLKDDDGEVSFIMPRFNIPEIRINKKYAAMLENARGGSDREKKEAASFVKEKMDSAKWFVEALKQRQNTLSKTMQAIIDFQRVFFETGDETKLKPMILEDIAKVTGFDISTISRVVNSKYIETPYKIYPLKYFFSEGLVNKAGEEVSTRELKTVLKQIVDAEDKHKPLTDEQLVSELSAKGYNVARRTIAKYRDQLGIPLARLRKEL
ncbi:MAG: RNA polymerase factor sigma-54 [Candidatus Cryptobacteroides sp.]|nr:RNA polymerase factor sigma-54 [Candidatus Cryptobacteroides sp.]